MEKPFEYKGKVLFFSGLFMLIAAGGIFAATGGIGKIASIFANEQTGGACEGPGCYSEQWEASEIFGLYRLGLNDDGRIDDNGWVSATGRRDCDIDDTPYLNEGRFVSSNLVADNSASMGNSLSCGYETNVWAESIGGTVGPGALDARYPMQVTTWKVNGHVH